MDAFVHEVGDESLYTSRPFSILEELITKIKVLAGELSVLDEPRKYMLTILLHQYIAIHYCGSDSIKSSFVEKCGYRESLLILINAYQSCIKHYGTQRYEESMQQLLFDGHMKCILECEEFI